MRRQLLGRWIGRCDILYALDRGGAVLAESNIRVSRFYYWGLDPLRGIELRTFDLRSNAVNCTGLDLVAK